MTANDGLYDKQLAEHRAFMRRLFPNTAPCDREEPAYRSFNASAPLLYPSLKCPACGSRETRLETPVNETDKPVLACAACGCSFNVRLTKRG